MRKMETWKKMKRKADVGSMFNSWTSKIKIISLTLLYYFSTIWSGQVNTFNTFLLFDNFIHAYNVLWANIHSVPIPSTAFLSLSFCLFHNPPLSPLSAACIWMVIRSSTRVWIVFHIFIPEETDYPCHVSANYQKILIYKWDFMSLSSSILVSIFLNKF